MLLVAGDYDIGAAGDSRVEVELVLGIRHTLARRLRRGLPTGSRVQPGRDEDIAVQDDLHPSLRRTVFGACRRDLRIDRRHDLLLGHRVKGRRDGTGQDFF